MPSRRIAALALAAVATLGACGTSDDADIGTGSATAGGDVVAVGPAPAPAPGGGIGGLGDAMEVAAGAPGQAADVACTVDRQALETAIGAYELLNGSLPTSEQELVDAQMIRELSPNFDVSADGALVPAAGSACR